MLRTFFTLLFLLFLGVSVSSFTAVFDVDIPNETNVSQVDGVTNFEPGRYEFMVTNADLSKIHVVDLKNPKVIEKDKALFNELNPMLVTSKGFDVIVEEKRGETCNYFLIGYDGEISEIPLSTGNQSISVDSLTNVFVGIDVDDFELCQANIIVNNKQLDLIIDFKVPFNESAYKDFLLNDRGVPCDDNSTKRCLRIEGETIDLDACVGKGVPLAYCIQGQSAIDNFLFEQSKEKIKELQQERDFFKETSNEAIANDVNNLGKQVSSLVALRNQDSTQDDDNLASIVLGVVFSVLIVGVFVLHKNQNDFETPASSVLENVRNGFVNVIDDAKSKVQNINNQKNESIYDVEPDVILTEEKFKPYKNNLDFWDGD